MKLSTWSSRLLILAATLCCAVSIQSKVINISSASEYENHVRSGKPIVVKFSASWCGACKMIKKEFEQLTQNPALSDIDFLVVDLDKYSDLAQKEGVRAVPTFLYIKDGAVKGKTVGGQDPKKFQAFMQQEIQKNLFKSNQSWWPSSCGCFWKKTKGLFTSFTQTIWSIGADIVAKIGSLFS